MIKRRELVLLCKIADAAQVFLEFSLRRFNKIA